MPQTNSSTTSRNPTIRRWATPPVPAGPEECVDQARMFIESAAVALVVPTPESLSRCEMCVRSASDRLQVLVKVLATSGAEIVSIREKVINANEELGRVYQLFQRAEQFHAALLHVVSARRSGYTRSGLPARLQCRRKLVLQG